MHAGEKKYPHIFSPGKIGKYTTKNRIKYNATVTNYCYRDGYVSPTEEAYIEAQARGGAGIVTTGGSYTDPKEEQKGYVNQMACYDDRFIPGMVRLADAIHKYEALACFQVMPCGRYGGADLDYSIGPSAVPQSTTAYKPMRAFTTEEVYICIQQCIDAFCRAAEAGYDIGELGGHVGYLVSNFVSKFTNKRTDEFGGDIHGRMKFVTDIIKGTHKVLGSDWPIGIRLSYGENLGDKGNSIEEGLQSMKIAEEAGAAWMSVTVGWHEAPHPTIHRVIPMGGFLPLVAEVKKEMKIPVMHAYRQFVPEIPEKAMAAGNLDYWEMCRPMMVEPNIPKLVLEDRQAEIRPCIGCNLCISRLLRREPMNCPVRPNMGHEGEPEWGYYGFSKDSRKLKITIVGAGPAGMQAGAIAAEKGHDVTIYEKSGRVGGQLCTAAHGVLGDEELQRVVDYLKSRCDRSGVKIILNKHVSQDTLKNENSDYVIIAAGAIPDTSVPGSNNKNVVTCLDAVEGKCKLGDNIVIVGGKAVGVQTAQTIGYKYPGKKITVICEEKKFGSDLHYTYRWPYKMAMDEKGVEVLYNSKAKEITDQGVVILDKAGKEQLIKADTVILAKMVKNDEFSYGGNNAKHVEKIGDCLMVRRLFGAIHDGNRAGMKVGYLPYQYWGPRFVNKNKDKYVKKG